MATLTHHQLRALIPATIKLEYPLINREKERPQSFWILEDLPVTLSNGQSIVIPAHFVTDFASVPKWLWSVFPPIGDHNLADLIHDYLYTFQVLSKADCDQEFLTWMEVLRPYPKSWLDNHLRYLAVHFFGGRAYRHHGELHPNQALIRDQTQPEFI